MLVNGLSGLNRARRGRGSKGTGLDGAQWGSTGLNGPRWGSMGLHRAYLSMKMKYLSKLMLKHYLSVRCPMLVHKVRRCSYQILHKLRKGWTVTHCLVEHSPGGHSWCILNVVSYIVPEKAVISQSNILNTEPYSVKFCSLSRYADTSLKKGCLTTRKVKYSFPCSPLTMWILSLGLLLWVFFNSS